MIVKNTHRASPLSALSLPPSLSACSSSRHSAVQTPSTEIEPSPKRGVWTAVPFIDKCAHRVFLRDPSFPQPAAQTLEHTRYRPSKRRRNKNREKVSSLTLPHVQKPLTANFLSTNTAEERECWRIKPVHPDRLIKIFVLDQCSYFQRLPWQPWIWSTVNPQNLHAILANVWSYYLVATTSFFRNRVICITDVIGSKLWENIMTSHSAFYYGILFIHFFLL